MRAVDAHGKVVATVRVDAAELVIAGLPQDAEISLRAGGQWRSPWCAWTDAVRVGADGATAVVPVAAGRPLAGTFDAPKEASRDLLFVQVIASRGGEQYSVGVSERRFRFDGLPPGRYRLSLERGEGWLGETDADAGDEDVVIPVRRDE
jgi:hypothetical protein